jgi:hypothetical protein
MHGSRFASRRLKTDSRPDGRAWLQRLDAATGRPLTLLLLQCLERYQFFGVKHEVPAALAAWLRGSWKLALLARVPKPSEVLKMQVRGTRPVSALCDADRLFRPILGKRNAFVFLQHDLEHAYHFFSDPDLHRLQRRLFVVLTAILAEGALRTMLGDREFRKGLHYLVSDMNTHPLHSLHYLRAILVEHFLRSEHGSATGALSMRAREQIARVFHAIAMRGEFDVTAYAALRRLADGGTDAKDAAIIEAALRGRTPAPVRTKLAAGQ